MQLIRYAWLILISMMLLSCAAGRTAQELQAGKHSFQSGDYKQAFHQLLPLAVKGKPEAQYAVGYMYYYGFGVPEDMDSGIFWMEKAAEQSYGPAIEALELIHRHDESRKIHHYHQENHGGELQTAPDRRRQYVPIMSALTPKKNEPLVEANKPMTRVAQTQEITPAQIQAARNYTLQLYGSFHLAAVKDLQMQLRLKNTGHVYHTTHQGKDWYVLTFGNFNTAHEASATQHNLPESLRQMHPWVRKVDALAVV